jgi:hypothetical protein
MINCQQLTDLVIKPALEDLLLYSIDAVELLLFTCAVESQGGTYLQQIKGPALGIYQMEPKTYNDIWINYINFENSIRLRLIHSFGINQIPSEDRLLYDLRYATAMVRIHYARLREPLPNAQDTFSLWDYYKTYYNTSVGKANINEAIKAYTDFKNN